MKKVSVVLPTYNERGSIEKTIQNVLQQEKELPGWRVEIVVSDSSSEDGTAQLVKNTFKTNSKVHIIDVDPGLGVGLIKGHQYSLEFIKPDILVQIDADGQVDPEIIVRLVKTIEQGYDLVLGSRFVEGGKNLLSPSRRIFSAGLSLISRVVMGPLGIGEFANSARAFTPALFKKINLNRLPWREKTFIIQPAFLHEAILAGAKYKEIPLVFKNRAEGYSKNKIVNYIYDVITYAIDARINSWGIKVPFFHWSRRSKTLIKFGLVGFIGTLIDFLFYKIFINMFGLPPATAKGFSAEIAIVNNFFFNNYWTFRHRKTKIRFWHRLGIYNLVSLGGLLMAVLVVKLLHNIYGDGFIYVAIVGKAIAYNNFYFFATIPPVMIWNFVINHYVTWRHKAD